MEIVDNTVKIRIWIMHTALANNERNNFGVSLFRNMMIDRWKVHFTEVSSHTLFARGNPDTLVAF